MKSITVPANYYRHVDMDFALDVPAEGAGGWSKADLPLSLEHTAVVVMHAWDQGTREQFPGLHRAVEYIPRAYGICRDVFPELLAAVRQSPIKLFHVVGEREHYYNEHPDYIATAELAGEEPPQPERIADDPVYKQLRSFRAANVYPGTHNIPDITDGLKRLNFAKEAFPEAGEAIAATSKQLFALCREHGINHLIYAGFAINWCLLLSPGGMADMTKHGILCSAIRQAVSAVENKETAREQLNKESALWRVALAFGYVYDKDDLIGALTQSISK